MMNTKSNSASNARHPATPIAMAASLVVGISGGCLVSVNPVLARPNSIPLTAVAPSLDTDSANLRSPAALLLASALMTSDLQVPQANPQDPIRGFWRWLYRFFFFNPNDPI
jgi:hypothetical protein